MTYVYLLAGENLELAEDELKGFLKSQEVDPDVERQGRLAIVNEEVMEGQLRRLALTHEVSSVVEEGSIEKMDVEYVPENSFSVRAIDINNEGHNTARIETKVGTKLSDGNNTVDLENPDEELKVYLTEDSYYLSRLVLDIDRGLYQKRVNQKRPFSSPVSLDPVLARVLVNLSGVKPGENLVDPFCGTGGILIEAGLCGIGVHGVDVKKEMVEGSRQNLEEYGIIVHDIREGLVNDLSGIFDKTFDAVVTDLPYGGASKVEGSPVQDFLDKAPEVCDGRIVFMSDRNELDGLKPEHEVYVHRNLTRYIYII